MISVYKTAQSLNKWLYDNYVMTILEIFLITYNYVQGFYKDK